MNAGIYSAVSGSLGALIRLDAITNNLANANTPGFKAERYVQRADAFALPKGSFAGVSTPAARGGVLTDFTQGSIQTTGAPLDLALLGDGFFVVQTPRGEALTRRGSFTLDSEGYITSSEGLRVQGESGPIQINRPGQVVIGQDGSVASGGSVVGKLRVVEVGDESKLVREGGVFVPKGEVPNPVQPESVRVVQGGLETSNVSAVTSLVSLVDTMRAFEAYARAADRLDNLTGRAISEVGKT